MGVCYIAGAGDFTARNLVLRDGDLLIAADGGYDALLAQGLTPHILLGDFDSLPHPPDALPSKTRLMRFPVEKDDTDTGLALKVAWDMGFRQFALYGCGGGRADHFLANLQTMGRYAQMGADIRLVDPHFDVFALHNGVLTLPPRPLGALVSVFCHGNCARGVTMTGLQYPLENASLTCDYPLGVSNHYAAETARVSVAEGTLLVLVGREE